MIKPPRAVVGPVAWLRDNLFSSIGNSILTVLGAAFIYFALNGLFSFALVNATWTGADGSACRTNDGACWPFVFSKFSQFMFGTYPEAERWRPKAGLSLGYRLAGADDVQWLGRQAPGADLVGGYHRRGRCSPLLHRRR